MGRGSISITSCCVLACVHVGTSPTPSASTASYSCSASCRSLTRACVYLDICMHLDYLHEGRPHTPTYYTPTCHPTSLYNPVLHSCIVFSSSSSMLPSSTQLDRSWIAAGAAGSQLDDSPDDCVPNRYVSKRCAQDAAQLATSLTAES